VTTLKRRRDLLDEHLFGWVGRWKEDDLQPREPSDPGDLKGLEELRSI